MAVSDELFRRKCGMEWLTAWVRMRKLMDNYAAIDAGKTNAIEN